MDVDRCLNYLKRKNEPRHIPWNCVSDSRSIEREKTDEMAHELLEEEEQTMREENILLPGEVKLTDEELTLMKTLLEDHLVKVQIALKKINHLQSEDGE